MTRYVPTWPVPVEPVPKDEIPKEQREKIAAAVGEKIREWPVVSGPAW